MNLTNDYEAFCFDEAVLYIQSFMYHDYKAKGKDYGKLKWRKHPHWSDEVRPRNNSEFFQQVQSMNQVRER